MSLKDASFFSTLSPLHLVRLASSQRKWNEAIRTQIQEQGIQHILTFNIPIEALSPDAYVLGDFDVKKDIGQISSQLLFTIAAAITFEMAPYDSQGRNACAMEQLIRAQAAKNGTLPKNNESFKESVIIPEVTYHCFELLRDNDEKVVGYRVWIFIADKSLYNIAPRINALFSLNIARKEEINSKKNQYKSMLNNLESTKAGNRTRPPGPNYQMVYENYYLELCQPYQWGNIIRMYTVLGLKNRTQKKKDDEDLEELEKLETMNDDDKETKILRNLTFDKNDMAPLRDATNEPRLERRSKFACFLGSIVQTVKASKVFGDDLTTDDHPWNPSNCMNKECAMILWTDKVKSSQRNIAEYFTITDYIGSKDDVEKLNLEELFAIDVKDSDFKDFPFPEDVFVLQRDDIVPSMLFTTIPPHLLEKGTELQMLMEIEKKRKYLYSKQFDKLAQEEKIERGFYDLMVVKSLHTKHAEMMKQIDLNYVEELLASLDHEVRTCRVKFAKSGTIVDPEDTESHFDDDLFAQRDIFRMLRRKNSKAYNYLNRRYTGGEKTALRKKIEKTNFWECWRAIKRSEKVPAVIKRAREWFFNLLPEQQWPNVSSRLTENLTLFGDFALRDILYISELERCVTNIRLARQLLKYRYNAFKHEDNGNHQRNNVCIPGPGMGGKSFLLNMLKASCIPGCVTEATHISDHAFSTEDIYDGEILIVHEASRELLGVEGHGSENKARILKERLERGVVNSVVFDVQKNKENGKRTRQTSACSCQGLTMIASNVNISRADIPLLSRFMVHMVPVTKSMPTGYRVNDRQKTQDTALNNRETNADERHQQVLIHVYTLFLETMLKANVFGRDVLMGPAVEVTNFIIDELEKKHKLDSVGIRLNSQLELINRSTCIEYALRVTHATPLSYRWSRNNGQVVNYDPMIIPELVLKFLFVTKEMIVHTITLESEFWEKNISKVVFKSISRYLLDKPLETSFMVKSSAKEDFDAIYDTDYVWVIGQDRHQAFDELTRMINDIGLTPAEMEKLINDVRCKQIDHLTVKPFMEEFNRQYEMARNAPKDLKQADKGTEYDASNVGGANQHNDHDMDDVMAGTSPCALEDDSDYGSVDDLSSIKSTEDFIASNPRLGRVVKDSHNSIHHRKKQGPRRLPPKGARKTKSSSNIGKSPINERPEKKQQFIKMGDHEGKFYVAFHIGELKRIESEFGLSPTSSVIEAVKTVFATSSYELYPESILAKVKKSYRTTEQQLIDNKLMTGLDGHPIIIPIITKHGEHKLVVPVTKFSPTITIDRGAKNKVIHNYNYIPLAAQAMLFENKVVQGMVNGLEERSKRRYHFDIDYETYIENCQLNGDDPMDDNVLLSLPIFTKRYIKSSIHWYPSRMNKDTLTYPEDFLENETKKVISIYLHNNAGINERERLNKSSEHEDLQSFTLDENGNYIQLKIHDGRGRLIEALGIKNGVPSTTNPITKSELFNLFADCNRSMTLAINDNLFDPTSIGNNMNFDTGEDDYLVSTLNASNDGHNNTNIIPKQINNNSNSIFGVHDDDENETRLKRRKTNEVYGMNISEDSNHSDGMSLEYLDSGGLDEKKDNTEINEKESHLVSDEELTSQHSLMDCFFDSEIDDLKEMDGDDAFGELEI